MSENPLEYFNSLQGRLDELQAKFDELEKDHAALNHTHDQALEALDYYKKLSAETPGFNEAQLEWLFSKRATVQFEMRTVNGYGRHVKVGTIRSGKAIGGQDLQAVLQKAMASWPLEKAAKV